MNEKIDNYEFRYEILSLGMGEPAYYLSPSTGCREYFRDVWGWYQPTLEAPIIPLSNAGKLRDLIVVFENHQLAFLEGTVVSEPGDLTVFDPRTKNNSFSGKLLFIGKLQNDTVLVRIADATGASPKAISLGFDRCSFPDVQEFLTLIVKQFKTMASGNLESVVNEYQHMFLSTETDSSCHPA